jgi:RNase P/RNase MRP subunit POP5
MATRERNRYVLCQIVTESSLGNSFNAENILFAYRHMVLSSWGELALATFGTASKVVISFAEFSGLFVARVPAKSLREASLALGGIIAIGSKPCAVRVLHVSGRLSNTAKVTIEQLIHWRNSLSPEFAIPRKLQLDSQLRASINSLLSLPSYL